MTMHTGMLPCRPMLYMNATSDGVPSGYRCESHLDIRNQPGFRRLPVWSLYPVLSPPCLCQHDHVREHQKIYGASIEKGCYVRTDI